MSNEDRAIELVAQAEKKVKSSQGFLGGLFGGASKLEDAAELYIQAGNAFKMAQKWSAAGKAFMEAAKLHINLQSTHEAGQRYLDAGNCFKKTDTEEAVRAFEMAINIYTDMGRFTMAAKHHITVAEIYEGNTPDLEKAILHYEQAAQYYRGEESNSSANKCLLKVAMYSAQMGEYAKALEIYEQVAADAIENSLLKYSAKEYFFKATLCHMCIDDVEAQRAVDKYCDMYPAFQDTRECKLLRTLLEAKEEQNTESFTEAIKDYDSISRLDQWLTTILLRIKKGMNEEPDLT